MAKQKKTPMTDAASVASYKHDYKRARIPTQEESILLPKKDKQPVRKSYAYDPSLYPQLVWAGKQEQGEEFSVPTVPIYVQEKIAPEALIARLKGNITNDTFQPSLFGVETVHDQFHKAVDFYKHEDNWQNRMILGDSLLVMNSLLEKEGMRGKVQMVYIDPPYGINFSSNWQNSTKERDVKNALEDINRQPEQVKAFRDTWELGIHSYLSYFRSRLIITRELLNDSGSCFIQIDEENVHFLRNVLDEVFGIENFVSLIPFRKKTMPLGAKYLDTMNDYIIWFAKDRTKLKYRQLYQDYNPDKKSRWNIDSSGNYYRLVSLRAPGFTLENSYSIDFEGKTYKFSNQFSWIVEKTKLEKLIMLGRIMAEGSSLSYKMTNDDFPYQKITNFWVDTNGPMKRTYVVETSNFVIERCMLMSTDPGDIVLDPTCGSGTTAFVAEQWGRRWITIDTSRVALALARQRLMASKYPYYNLKDDNSISQGFNYKLVSHITLKSLANDEEPTSEILFDQPSENKSLTRVTGPFTVESLSPHRVSDEQEMINTERYVNIIIENLRKAGVQTGQKGARLEFVNLDILGGAVEIQARGEYKTATGTATAAVAVGPEFGSVDDDFIRDAVGIAKRFATLLVVAAPSFDASAHSVPTEVDGLTIMKVKINPDLSMGDLLKKTGSGNLFLAFGQPDVKTTLEGDTLTVEVLGVDVYDPVKGELRSSGSGNLEHDIAAWFIDSNYSGDAFFVTQAYFLGADKPYDKLKKALKADINEELWEELYSTRSRPFPKPKSGKIAVKVINHYGDEVMKVIEVASHSGSNPAIQPTYIINNVTEVTSGELEPQIQQPEIGNIASFNSSIEPPKPKDNTQTSGVEQHTFSDYSLYKCLKCGTIVMGFNKKKHETDTHAGEKLDWFKTSK
jgi:adenine-specific DNA-methyltransferase